MTTKLVFADKTVDCWLLLCSTTGCPNDAFKMGEREGEGIVLVDGIGDGVGTGLAVIGILETEDDLAVDNTVGVRGEGATIGIGGNDCFRLAGATLSNKQ